MREAGDRIEAHRVLAQSGLPADVRARLIAVLNGCGLRGPQLAEVASELTAHFEDGLRAGRSADDLLATFGDERVTARMIARQKRRGSGAAPPGSREDSIMDMLLQNLRHSTRRLMQNPGFTLTAVASLAIGIGANIAIFSLVNAVLLKPPPLRAPGELVEIYSAYPGRAYGQSAYPDFEDLRAATQDAFSGLAASAMFVGQVDREGSLETVLGEVVSGNYFELLGLEASLGRALEPSDDTRPGAHPLVMISHGYWRRAFGADRNAVGRDLRLNGRPYTIVGVTREDFRGSMPGLSPDVYAPAMMYDAIELDTRAILRARNSHRFFVKGRLRSGVNLAQARAAADRAADQLRKDFGWSADRGFVLVPQTDVIVYPPLDGFVRAAAWLLSVTVGLVLLVACANLAGFLLARSLDRRREVAVRMAVGASRRALLGQMLTETTMMGVIGGLGGTALAAAFLRGLTTADLPRPIPITLDVGIDGSVALFGLAVSVGAGILLGLVPAFQGTQLDVASTLKSETAGSGTSRRRLTLRNGLVAAQVAVSIVLLVGAGLFLRSLGQAQAVDPGFGHDPAAMLSVAMPPSQFPEVEGRLAMQRLLERIEAIPGVRGAGITNNMLLRKTGRDTLSVRLPESEARPGREWLVVDRASVDQGLFEALGIPLPRGRHCEPSDRADTRPVASVSAAMAERFWPKQDPIGHTIRRDDGPDLVVVGLARDAKVLDLSESPQPFIYLPYSQAYSAQVQIVARTSGDPARTALEMAAAAREVDPSLVLWSPTTMDRHLGFVTLPARMSAAFLAAVAAIALLLAVVGLYGTVSYAVSRRTREVGIRMSLGADAGTVTVMLMRSGLRLVATGGAVGLALAALAARALGGLLFGIAPLDPATFLAAPLVLVAAATLAVYVAARRASRVDPVQALRAE